MPPRKRRSPTKKAEPAPQPVTTTLLYDPDLDTPDGGHQPPLDGMPPLPEKKRAPKRKPKDTNVIRWARYKVQNPQKCDECMIEAQKRWETGTVGPAPFLACYRRSQHGVTTYLCWVHQEARRRMDGLPKLRPGNTN